MKMPPSPVDNKNSRLLSTEENFQVFKLLGNRCQSLATAVVQVFVTTPPQHLQWAKKDTGVLCFVRDNNRKNYFFRLFCLRRNTMTWEHEMYNNLEYIESRPFFHMFEGEENIVAFNFAQSNEALDFKAVVDQKVAIKRQKEERRARKINLSQSIGVPQPANNIDFGLKQELRKKKRKKNLTKDDIGFPYHFTHVSHVGFDPSAGFDLKGAPPELQQILKKAGVSEKLLRDTDTRNFIYDFISNHSQGNENITPPPAVPPRGPPRPPSSRPAPPPPPYNRSAPPSAEAVQRKARPPSPPKNVGSAPPPPPPPPPMNIPAPPPMLDMDQAPQPPYSPKANPEALFESIRNGTNLKSVEERRITPVDDARGDLLSEIRKGIQLKKVDEREIKAPQNASPPSRGNDLASALAKALAERSKMIHSEDDDDGDSSTSNEDEWD